MSHPCVEPKPQTLWDRRKKHKYTPRSSALQIPATLRRHAWYLERASLGLQGQTTQDRVFEFSLQLVQRPEARRPQLALRFQAPRVQPATRRGFPRAFDSPASHATKPEWETAPEGRKRER